MDNTYREIDDLEEELGQSEAERVPKSEYCAMNINVLLDSYNTTLGSFPIVFQVKTETNGKTLYNNVVCVEMDSTGTKTLRVEGVGPEGCKVTVTQVYNGGNYKLVSEPTKFTILSKKKIKEVDFKQTYDNKVIGVSYGFYELIKSEEY